MHNLWYPVLNAEWYLVLNAEWYVILTAEMVPGLVWKAECYLVLNAEWYQYLGGPRLSASKTPGGLCPKSIT